MDRTTNVLVMLCGFIFFVSSVFGTIDGYINKTILDDCMAQPILRDGKTIICEYLEEDYD